MQNKHNKYEMCALSHTRAQIAHLQNYKITNYREKKTTQSKHCNQCIFKFICEGLLFVKHKLGTKVQDTVYFCVLSNMRHVFYTYLIINVIR